MHVGEAVTDMGIVAAAAAAETASMTHHEIAGGPGGTNMDHPLGPGIDLLLKMCQQV